MFKERIALPALLILVIALLLLGALYAARTRSALAGTIRPLLHLRSLSGFPTRLPVPFLRRHILLIFTPSCPHCRTVLHHFSRLTRLDPVIPCYGISLGSRSSTDSLVRSMRIPFPVLLDRDRHVQTVLRIDRVPVVVFVDDQDVIRLTLAGARTFQEDSILFVRFGRSGAPGTPDVGGQVGTGHRPFPDAPTADDICIAAPSACLAGEMSDVAEPAGPRNSCGTLRPSDGPPQAAGPYINRS